MLRLIHGDVYCGARLKKFKMSEIDTCIRCFEKETIKHLSVECPYTKEIWSLLGINSNDTKSILGTHLTNEELEIHAVQKKLATTHYTDRTNIPKIQQMPMQKH
jgi:hypothetical protein